MRTDVMRTRRRDAIRESWRLRAEIHTPRDGWHQRGACYRCTGAITVDLCEQDCPLMVRLDCLAAAIIEERHVAIADRFGIRGGLPAKARTTPYVPVPAECGTEPGYKAHRRRNETTCADCRRAHNAYVAALDAKAGRRDHRRKPRPSGSQLALTGT